MLNSAELLLVGKKIIRGAVEIGLDEAGARICGPTAWKYVKAALTPAFEELEKRFPRLFLATEEAEKAAQALSTDPDFAPLVTRGLAQLREGQQDIMALLARQSTTLSQIGNQVDAGYALLGDKMDRLHEAMQVIADGLAGFPDKAGAADRGAGAPSLALEATVDAIYAECASWQADGQRYMEAGDTRAASARLAQGRALAQAGLQRHPLDARLLSALGFIEKTQAQVAQRDADYAHYLERLESAAKCFAAVLASDPRAAAALNGMANVYLLNRDYRRAAELGSLAVALAPAYGAALWDLAIAQEGQLREYGRDGELAAGLVSTYRRLEALMPRQPEMFSAQDLMYIQGRSAALGNG